MKTIFIIMYWIGVVFSVTGLLLLGYEFIKTGVAEHKEVLYDRKYRKGP